MAEASVPTPTEAENTGLDQEICNKMETPVVDEGMERFLQKTKSELMYELRRIQHGERPVTGRDYRENIDQFFSKRLETPAGAEGKANVPANVDCVEEHRPDSVVVEVQGLFEQQRVSSVLQSTAFRRSLERIIRGSIGRSREQSNTPRPRSTPSRTSTPSVATPETRSRAQSEENVISDAASVVSTSSNESPPRIPTPPALPPQAANHTDGVILNQQELPTWQDIAQIQHDEIIQEISELLHSRLVSSTLEGEFRGTLEVQMQNHIAHTGANGEAVANFVRNLPTGDHLRNDFSHLGLAPPQENWDNISVTSLSATAVPYTQSNLHLSREIASLRHQMEEMKNMVKLSFDLQLDIQRAIRQEVAAAIAQATASQGASAIPLPTRPKPISDSHCLICLDAHADSVLYQCGHMCMCFACGKHLISRGGKCPVCRAPIRDIIRAYKCNED